MNLIITLLRKPLEDTVARNVLRYGTGSLNIDACRIEGAPWKEHRATGLAKVKFFSEGEAPEIDKRPHSGGRWPANLVLSRPSAEVIDDDVGITRSGAMRREVSGYEGESITPFLRGISGPHNQYGDSGGVSRFFLVLDDVDE